jgi:hypothetical protein
MPITICVHIDSHDVRAFERVTNELKTIEGMNARPIRSSEVDLDDARFPRQSWPHLARERATQRA